jgi:hypothetical protein
LAGVALDADGAAGGVAQHPFDADGAGAAADVPQRLAGAGRQGGESDGADLLFGQLSVMGEEVVRQAGGERDDAGARAGHDVERHEVEAGDVLRQRVLGEEGADAFVGAAEGFQHVQPGGAEAACGEGAGEGGGRGAVGGERQDAAAWVQQRDDRLQWAAAE